MGKYDQYRNFLKSNFSEFKTILTDARKGLPQPPKGKPYDKNAKLIDLPRVNENILVHSLEYNSIPSRMEI